MNIEKLLLRKQVTKMNILAIDTSSAVASVAVLKDGVTAGEYSINNGKTHSQIIVPMVCQALDKSGITLDDVDVFAVTLGPGSFTGLRIGVATAKTFAQAKGKEIIGVSSLDSLCVNACFYNDVLICPIIDARRGNVYNAVYKNGEKLKEDRLISLDSLFEELGQQKVVFLGDGAIKHKEIILSKLGDNAVFVPEHLAMQKASSAAYLAQRRAECKDYDNLYNISPIYVRSSQAEREIEGIKD